MESTIGLRIKRCRAALGWTATELAAYSGLKKAQLSRYEIGKAIPRADAVAKIAKALNVSFEWLMDGTGSLETGEEPTVGISGAKTIELPEDLDKIVRDYADAHGLTAEMAIITLIREFIHQKQDEKPNIDELADKIADKVERRLKNKS
jgi:transcriptional regulator with XRE-family HTH domain